MVRARRKGALKPWIGTKISRTIVEFGLPLIEQLPPAPSRELRISANVTARFGRS